MLVNATNRKYVTHTHTHTQNVYTRRREREILVSELMRGPRQRVFSLTASQAATCDTDTTSVNASHAPPPHIRSQTHPHTHTHMPLKCVEQFLHAANKMMLKHL